jgi:carotenoid cleavage dioxygenase
MANTETTTDTPVNEATYRFLEGNFAPVADEVTLTDLRVTGSIPAALEGRYLRNGPNPLAADPGHHHWFIGDGMLHGVRLRDGQAEWYRNRWVRTPTVSEALGEPAVPLDLTFLGAGPANTNVVHHAGSILALCELFEPFEMTPELETIRSSNFGGLPAGMTAHPKFDPDRGDLHVMAYSVVEPYLRYHVIDPTGRITRADEVAVGGPVMVHDMGLTERYAIAFDLPVVFSLEAAMGGAALPYQWDRDYTPRVGLIPRAGTAADTIWVELDEPCFVYHPLNAYDDGDAVVVDLVVHPRAFDDPVHGDPAQGTPSLQRWTIGPSGRSFRREVIDERGQEFPRADERLATKRHRYGYAVGADLEAMGDGTTDEGTQLLKHDVVAGTSTVHEFGPGRVPSEFVFVPAADDAGEDEGWLIGYVSDHTTGTAAFEILDATDVAAEPVGRVDLPVRIPVGFHGNWIPDRALA